MSGQIHAPVSLPARKGPPYETRGSPHVVNIGYQRDKIPVVERNREVIRPVDSNFAI
jgi:hypothetical protein